MLRVNSLKLMNLIKASLSARQFACKKGGSGGGGGSTNIREVMAKKIPPHLEMVKKFRKEHGNDVTSKTTVNTMYGGMRTVLGGIYETSNVDPNEGITFRGLSIPEVRKRLPKSPDGGEEPLAEGMIWLLLTSDVPNKEQVAALTKELNEKSKLPKHIVKMLDGFPKTLHPMAQLSAAITCLNHDSKFVKAYNKGVKKLELWKPALDDGMDLIAKIAPISAIIYNNTYKEKGKGDRTADPELDWSANFAKMMGYMDCDFWELMRLYLTIHCDHEGGNVSAHTTHLVGSALSDPFLSYAAGLNGLAGPLHGLANQEVLVWLQKMQKEVGDNPTEDKVRDYVKKTLAAGQVVPGYGHAKLRKTDPRYTCQAEFAKKHMPDDPLVKLVATVFKVVPPVLTELGKVKNPWPNVDAHSGCLLMYYGMKEMNFYTVLFGVSRAMGCISALVWSRAMGLSIERPTTLTTHDLMKRVKKGKKGGGKGKCGKK